MSGAGPGEAAAEIPRGLWAVASGLTSREAAQEWAAGAEPAAAFTFRKPQCEEGVAVAAARALSARKWCAVHARGDWAFVAGARAVIAGARSLPPAKLKEVFPNLWLGCSVHDWQEIRDALEAGADFLVYGPVWETPSKHAVLAPRGVDALREVCELPVPVVAIGGIEAPEQVTACRAAGAHACAALRAARHATRPAELAAAWRADP